MAELNINRPIKMKKTLITVFFFMYSFMEHNRLHHSRVQGVSYLGVPGVPQILEDQLTISQPGGQIMPT